MVKVYAAINCTNRGIKGSVILEDILTIAPFGNTMDIVGLKGKHLREVLEASVREYDFEALDPPGAFLQVSGARDRLDKARDQLGEGLKKFGEGSKKVLEDATKILPGLPKPGDIFNL